MSVATTMRWREHSFPVITTSIEIIPTTGMIMANLTTRRVMMNETMSRIYN